MSVFIFGASKTLSTDKKRKILKTDYNSASFPHELRGQELIAVVAQQIDSKCGRLRGVLLRIQAVEGQVRQRPGPGVSNE